MSFEIVCKKCGAFSGPSVGICPYCKAAFSGTDDGAEGATVSGILRLYADGKLEKALGLMTAAVRENPKLEEEVPFLLLQVKILLETEGPEGKIRAALSKAYLLEPDNAEVAEYSDLMDARAQLEPGVRNDLGEQALKNLLRRSPKNPHALFLLGTHLFWAEKDAVLSAPYLQRCVDARPAFLRAWACLGMVYRTSGHEELALRAFRKCLELETQPQMVKYFKGLVGKAA